MMSSQDVRSSGSVSFSVDPNIANVRARPIPMPSVNRMDSSYSPDLVQNFGPFHLSFWEIRLELQLCLSMVSRS